MRPAAHARSACKTGSKTTACGRACLSECYRGQRARKQGESESQKIPSFGGIQAAGLCPANVSSRHLCLLAIGNLDSRPTPSSLGFRGYLEIEAQVLVGVRGGLQVEL